VLPSFSLRAGGVAEELCPGLSVALELAVASATPPWGIVSEYVRFLLGGGELEGVVLCSGFCAIVGVEAERV
jgi:hypothetical protein